jgi:hypothetical protein
MTTDDCCLDKACVVEQLREGQATNPAPGAGGERHDVCRRGCLWLAGSVALLADSLDMLGDDMVYGFSLYIVSRGPIWKARAAVAKALVMGLFGAMVFGQLVYKLAYLQLPTFETMGVVGVLALAVNSVCFGLLDNVWSGDF